MGGDYEGDLTAAACPLGGAFALFGESLLHSTFVQSWFDERDCPCRRELDNCPVQIPYYTPPPTNLGGWGITVIAALDSISENAK